MAQLRAATNATPVRCDLANIEPRHLWMLGLTIDEQGAVVGPGRCDIDNREESDWLDNCIGHDKK
jgi:hypothetical protein